MTDPLTYLDEVDARVAPLGDGYPAYVANRTIQLRLMKEDVPALSKALRAVLEHHAQGEVGCPHPTHKCNDPDYRGLLCADAGPECEAGCGGWPCVDVQAIQAALAVNDEGGKR